MKYIIVTFVIDREGDQSVSHCVELGTFSCGNSETEALENIADATGLYLHTLEDVGECERILQEKGVQVHSGVTVSPRIEVPPHGNIHSGVLPLPVEACV